MTKGITFYKRLSLKLCFFKRYVAAVFEINVLKEVRSLRYLYKNITNTIFHNKGVPNYT